MPGKPFHIPPQWLAMCVFWLSFSINFLDRQLLASVAPALKAEFQLSNAQYGQLISGFYLVYALACPLAGLFVDRFGLRFSAAAAVTFWSLAGAATAFTSSFQGLLACRMGLGLGESAGFPTLGKANVSYLTPAERGIAGGFGAASISLGAILAPLIAAAVAPRYGWRSVFLFGAAFGLLWVPLWLFVSGRIPPLTDARVAVEPSPRHLLRDHRLWSIALAYCMVYTLYSLWSNWTTIYLVQERHLTLQEANSRYAWFPPAFAILGGFFGGSLAFMWIRKGVAGALARLRVCWFTVPLLLIGATVPFMPTTTLAVVAIGISFLAFQSMLGSLFLIPLDLFGSRTAGFVNSLLGLVAASTQVVIAPAIGATIDRFGFTTLCVAVPLLPIFGLTILQVVLRATPVVAVQAPAQ